MNALIGEYYIHIDTTFIIHQLQNTMSPSNYKLKKNCVPSLIKFKALDSQKGLSQKQKQKKLKK